MKKLFLVLLSISIIGNTLIAQNADFKNTISAHYGMSLFNISKGDFTNVNADSVKYDGGGFSHVPTLGLAWDYGIAKWFSIGVAASYNQAKASVTNLQVLNNNGTFEKLGDFSITVPRTTLSARFLFHYGNKGRFDCYSGFRFGAGLWSVKTSSNIDKETLRRAVDGIKDQLGSGADLSFIDDIDTKIKAQAGFVLPQAQLIAFGLRGYVTENIGINGELAVGSPYFLSIGANYRF